MTLSHANVSIIISLLLVIPAYWSVAISRKTATRQLRAYISVGVEYFRLERNSSSGKWVINFTYKNNGLTPAYHTSIAFAHSFCDSAKIELPNLAQPYLLGTVGPSDLLTDSEPTNLSDSDVEGLKEGKTVLFLSGVIKYVDAFKARRQTEFCFYTGGLAPFGGPDDPELTVYQRGNDAN